MSCSFHSVQEHFLFSIVSTYYMIYGPHSQHTYITRTVVYCQSRAYIQFYIACEFSEHDSCPRLLGREPWKYFPYSLGNALNDASILLFGLAANQCHLGLYHEHFIHATFLALVYCSRPQIDQHHSSIYLVSDVILVCTLYGVQHTKVLQPRRRCAELSISDSQA